MVQIRRTPRTTFLIALVAVGLYLSSIGPVAWLICRFHLPQWVVAIIATIYDPLLWVEKTFPPGADWIKGYVGLWVQGREPKTGPELPLPFVRELLAVLIASWFIWNVVGWFTTGRKYARRGETMDTDISPDPP